MRLIAITFVWGLGLLLAAGGVALAPLTWGSLAVCTVLAAWLLPPHRRWLALLLTVLLLGGLRYALTPTSSSIAAFNERGGLTIEGIVAEAPRLRETYADVRVDVQTGTQAGMTTGTSGLVLVRAPLAPTLHYGDRIVATGQLNTPSDFGSFSYTDYLARAGVYSLMSNAAVEMIGRGEGSPIYRALFTVRERAATAIRAALPEPQAGLLSAILLGDEGSIAQSTSEAFSAAGAAHLLAISGFNMVVVAAAVERILKSIGARRELVIFLSLAVIAAYTALTGASASILRAALMAGVLVIGNALRRRTFVPTSLAFVVLLLTVLNPLILWDVGFQLSMLGAFGLAAFATPFNRAARDLLPNTIREATATSAAAQVTTLPLIALVFGRLSWVALPVNILIVPLQPLIMLLGGLAVAVALLSSTLAQPLFALTFAPLTVTWKAVESVARLPIAESSIVAEPNLVTVFYLGMTALVLSVAVVPRWWTRLVTARVIRLLLLIICACGLVLIVVAFTSRPDGRLHVWLLNVGDGNAVFVQSPRGAHLLVDGGRSPARLLTALGSRMPFDDRQVELLALTQPDEFDLIALPSLLDRYSVDQAIWSGQPNVGDVWQTLSERLAGRMQVVSAGNTLTFEDGVFIEVLHPMLEPTLDTSLNDAALVLRVRYGEASFLLMGDASLSVQTELLANGVDLTSTVLQLPRHAAPNSLDPAFLVAVQPQIVMYQASEAGLRSGQASDPTTLALLNDPTLPRLPQLFTATGEQSLHFSTDGASVNVAAE